MTNPATGDREPTPGPCPMCGFSSHLRIGAAFGQLIHFVECQDATCLVKGPEHLAEAEAIAAWNRRTPRPSSNTIGGELDAATNAFIAKFHERPASSDIYRERVREAMAAALSALQAPQYTGEPVAWRCKDYADGWIVYQDFEWAQEMQREMGCLMQPLYAKTDP